MRNFLRDISIVALLCTVILTSTCTKQPTGSIIVTTNAVTEITGNSAKTGGSVTSSGYSIGECGVCYSESYNPTLNNSFTKDQKGDGEFSSTLSDLKSGTQYYVRAYAKTSSGIEYGKEVSFTTQGGYTINVFANPTAGGTVTGAGTYQPEESCTVTATANTGYTFTNWTENGTIFSSNESYSFTVAGSRNLTANFSLINYSVAVSVEPENSGTVSGGGNYDYGQSCTVSARANTGYVFTNWTENGEVVSANANYTFTVSGNRNLVANFTVPTYTISVSSSPSSGGSISGGGFNFLYGQSWTVTATANSGYVFVNWSENGNVVSSNASYTFSITSDRTLVANFDGLLNGHTYIDLGLPSGTCWATCNVGATTPEGFGDYFAWGETITKYYYNWSTYKYCTGEYDKMTKYCNDPNYGHNGFTDNLTILQAGDDAATAKWGSGWRTPTREEWEELIRNTGQSWITRNGVKGTLFTASNGRSIFIPAAGIHGGSNFYNDDFGEYWSSSLSTEQPSCAWKLYIQSIYCHIAVYEPRNQGLSVRPVRQE